MKALRAILSKYSPADTVAAAKALLAHSAHQDILATIHTSLVLFEDKLLNTLNGEYRPFSLSEGQSRAEALAQAAQQLLPSADTAKGILLLLPPAEFVSTRYHLALNGEGLLRSALKLQAHTLIPAYEADLLLALNASQQDGVALWYPARQADALFLAFQAQGLFLAAVMPRTWALASAEQHQQDLLLLDEDAHHQVQMELRGGALRSHYIVSQHDLQQPEFAEQWQTETGKVQPAYRIRSQGWDGWNSLRSGVQPHENYCFFPQGAEFYGRKLWREKQKRAGMLAAAVVAGLLCLPFISNWLQIAYLDYRVEALRADSTVARQSQAAVYAMDDEWGVIADYPKQDVTQVLLSLNQQINNSLATFALEKGVVDITGFAQDPALLVEQLAEREEFFNVSQSRSSAGGEGGERGDRFGIRFNLNGVDFPGYLMRYPPVKQ
jgi:hypothetical protein